MASQVSVTPFSTGGVTKNGSVGLLVDPELLAERLGPTAIAFHVGELRVRFVVYGDIEVLHSSGWCPFGFVRPVAHAKQSGGL